MTARLCFSLIAFAVITGCATRPPPVDFEKEFLDEKAKYEPNVEKTYWLLGIRSLCPTSTTNIIDCPMIPEGTKLRTDGIERGVTSNAYYHVTLEDNANLDFKLSSPTSPLTSSIVAILKTLLPIKIPTPKCSLLVTDIPSVSVSSKDNEADIDAAVVMALRECAIFNREDVNVRISVAVIAAASPPNQIKWKIVRQPVLGIPNSWFIVLELAEGSPQQVLQHFLDSYASINLPSIKGIRAAVQGANFDGDQNNLSFRIKADAHANGTDLTSLLGALIPLIDSKLDFKIQQPK